MSEVKKLVAEIKSDGLLSAGHKLESLYTLAEQAESDCVVGLQLIDRLTRQLTDLQQQLGAVVAENAVIKSGVADITFMKDDDFFGSTSEAQRVMGYLVNIQTPATDAILNAVRAEGVEICISAADTCISAGEYWPPLGSMREIARSLRADAAKGGSDD